MSPCRSASRRPRAPTGRLRARRRRTRVARPAPRPRALARDHDAQSMTSPHALEQHAPIVRGRALARFFAPHADGPRRPALALVQHHTHTQAGHAATSAIDHLQRQAGAVGEHHLESRRTAPLRSKTVARRTGSSSAGRARALTSPSRAAAPTTDRWHPLPHRGPPHPRSSRLTRSARAERRRPARRPRDLRPKPCAARTNSMSARPAAPTPTGSSSATPRNTSFSSTRTRSDSGAPWGHSARRRRLPTSRCAPPR